MTSAQSPDRPPAWFVTTDQGVVLAGPFPDRTDAVTAYRDVVAGLRRDLTGRQPGEYIAARVRAVRVAWGRTRGPHAEFVEG